MYYCHVHIHLSVSIIIALVCFVNKWAGIGGISILTYYATQLSLPVAAGNVLYYKAYIELARPPGLWPSMYRYTWQGSVHSEASVAKKAILAVNNNNCENR